MYARKFSRSATLHCWCDKIIEIQSREFVVFAREFGIVGLEIGSPTQTRFCTAKSDRTGHQCRSSAMAGWSVCWFHRSTLEIEELA